MKPNLERAVDGILESYRDIGGINHLEGPNLPSQQSVARIVVDLESLVFPGFHEEENLDLAGTALGDRREGRRRSSARSAPRSSAACATPAGS